MAFLKTGLDIIYDGKPWVVEHVEGNGLAHIAHTESGTSIRISLDEQEQAYLDDRLSFPQVVPKGKKSSQSDYFGLKPEDEAAFTRQCDYLRLVSTRAEGCSKQALEFAIREVASLIGDKRPPHISTFYRWRHSHQLAMTAGQLRLPAHTDKGNRRSRQSPEVVGLAYEFLERYYIQELKFSLKKVWELILARIESINESRAETEKLALPGYSATRGILQRNFSEFYIHCKRHGRLSAHMAFRLAGKS